MDDENKQALLDAVRYFISCDRDTLDDAMFVLKHMATINHRTKARLKGEVYRHLNPILDLQLEDRKKMKSVLTMINNKRTDTVAKDVSGEISSDAKAEYQRNLMRTRRERENRAVAVENMTRPKDKQLRGLSRLNFINKTNEEWSVRREAALKKATEVNGGSLSREALSKITSGFWQKIDEELDELEELARKM